ncbi:MULTISPECIES: fluoride efflux transporter CrcB [Actinopolyspora]|uniref:Fluoride-specific ion channel FluC n=1 Tax=Actinopolyspora saharensis TaxID=995062 RepID=A0A1H1FUY2_9ACTN|nr:MULTISPECIES: fluoride efflux transporter CrcB [Actinopolyspora]NHD16183.1 fluoride efflux transporter CrcB [Actinopolyspora sp. BKK2]NHE75954.1 fluoride efflux transporter CrcB [Actinopolyspora sp. BKK1]SDR04670.1 CrcB protein [Actinopolyspora saharensis]
MTPLLVALGGACGALSRYGIDSAVRRFGRGAFPWATLVVNLLGSFLIALVTGWAAFGGNAPSWVRTLLVAGLCGALTTFSTFGVDTVRLYVRGARFSAVLNVLVTVLGGLLAAGVGLGAALLSRGW